MLSLFSDAKHFLKLDKVSTDDFVFRLHYKASVILHVLFLTMLGAKQYFGDPIQCDVAKAIVSPDIMNTYCWISGTWTIQELVNDHFVKKSLIVHQGVGPYYDGYTKIYHRYYQWVPTLLLFVTIFFYIPRFCWKIVDGGRMKRICIDLMSQETEEEIETERVARLMKMWHLSSPRNRTYYRKYFACQFLSLNILILVVMATNCLFNYTFTSYGREIINYYATEEFGSTAKAGVNPMELIFPKVTKCTFMKHGTSGTLVPVDGLCVVPLNILNEKVFLCLWIWYWILGVITVAFIFFRLLTFVSPSFRRFYLVKSLPATPSDVVLISKDCSAGDFFVLCLMEKNIDSKTFKNFLSIYAAELRNRGYNRDDVPHPACLSQNNTINRLRNKILTMV